MSKRNNREKDLWPEDLDVIGSIDSGTKHILEEAVEKLQTKLELALHPAELEQPSPKAKKEVKRPPRKVDQKYRQFLHSLLNSKRSQQKPLNHSASTGSHASDKK